MEKLILSKERDLKDRVITLKTVDDFKEFKEVIKVFSGYPYYEPLTDQDCKDEYELYLQKGIVIGHYIDDKIAGINCIVYEPNTKQSIKFDDKDQIAYYSGFAVKQDLWGNGIGNRLMKATEDYLIDLNRFNYEYARILCDISMSEGTFKRYGFTDFYDSNNNLVIDDVEYMDINDQLHKDKRKYMVKKLNNKGNGITRR